MSVTEPIGREEEFAALQAFLREGAQAVVLLEGDAGVGKTTLWRAAVAAAEAHGLGVVSTRPVLPEQGLAFSALNDLLGTALVERRGDLSPPRRRALEATLLLRDGGGQVPDEQVLAFAVAELLLLLAEERPLLVAIDDVQWVDRLRRARSRTLFGGPTGCASGAVCATPRGRRRLCTRARGQRA